MSDQRSVMKEFRSLDAKRAAAGLTPAEEARYADLRDLVGGEAEIRPGFDVDAAAAQLRDSLLPAGLRNRAHPSPPVEPAEEPSAEAPLPEPGADDLAALGAEPQPDGSFDLSALEEQLAPAYDTSAAANEPAQEAAWEPGAPYDPNAPPYDPNAAGYDPNAQPYDPNAAAYDPNAQPYDPSAAAYDPNAQPYDPNAAAYDPNAQPYDPNAPAYDPNAPPYDTSQGWDPNAPAAVWDPDAPQEAGAEPYAGAEPAEAGQAYDPNAPAAYDADAAYDPNAPYDPNASPEAGVAAYPPLEPAALAEGEAAPFSPDTTAEFAPGAAEVPPEGWYAEAAAAEPVPGGEAAPAGDEAALESLLPFDAAAEASITPGEVPEGFGRALGEYDDTSGFAGRLGEPTPADLPQEGAGFQAAQAVAAEESAGWHPDAELEEGFQLASGGSFDATAEAAAPEWAGGTPPPPWEAAGQAEAPPDLLGAPEPTFSLGESFEGVAAGPEVPLEAPLEAAAELPFEAAAEASLEAPAEIAVEAQAGAPAEAEYLEPLAPEPEAGVEAGAEPAQDVFAELPPPAEQAAALAPEPPPEAGAGEDFTLDIEEEVPADLAEPAPALDFSRPDFSAGEPSEEEAALAAAGAAALGPAAGAAPSFDLSLEPEPGAAAPPELGAPEDLALEAPPAPAAAAPALLEEEEIPTIDGEEILEEIVEEVPAPEAALEAAAGAEPAAPAPTVLVPAPPPEPEAVAAPPPAAPARVTPKPAAPPRPAVIAAPPAPARTAAPPAAPPAVAPSPPAAAAAAAVPEPAGADTWLIPGSHRVVVHTVEGQVKRGLLEDVDLAAGSLALLPQAGASAEDVPAEKVKAIFFMLGPGEKAPVPEGKKVRVTFRDGRQVAGFSPDYREEGVGFFMIPGDTRTNTGRIWVYRSAVKQVAVS